MKKDWTATHAAFHGLVAWLDEGTEARGEAYVEMHSRLAAYFTRKRCASPDDLADETLTRVARRLSEEGAITDVPPAKYCYIVARFVFLEYLRGAGHDQLKGDVVEPRDLASGREDERVLDRLEHCLARLDARDRDLILDYYAGGSEERITRRRDLARRLELTLNALTIRASRLRERLRACLSSKEHEA